MTYLGAILNHLGPTVLHLASSWAHLLTLWGSQKKAKQIFSISCWHSFNIRALVLAWWPHLGPGLLHFGPTCWPWGPILGHRGPQGLHLGPGLLHFAPSCWPWGPILGHHVAILPLAGPILAHFFPQLAPSLARLTTSNHLSKGAVKLPSPWPLEPPPGV